MTNRNFTLTVLAVLILLIISFFSGRCSNEKEKEIVTVTKTLPAITGKSDTIYEVKPLITTKDSLVYKDRTIYTESPYDKELVDRYTKLESETDKLKAYLNANQIHEYKVPFEDSIVSIVGNIKTRGDLLSTQYDYKIKEREISLQMPVKKTVFAVYVGGGIGNTVSLDKASVFGNLGIQNKRGDIISLQYSTDKNIQLGYSFRILDIKK